MSKDRPAGLIRSAITGLLVAAMSIVFSISFASLVFAGPLAPFRETGVLMALMGSVVYGVFSAFGGSAPGVWMGNQTTPIVIVTLGAASLSQSLPTSTPDELFATVVVFMASATLCCGLVLLAMGSLGMGQIARFIPYPVVAGFLATTGMFLMLRAMALMSGSGGEITELVEPEMMQKWLPFAALGLAVSIASRWVGPAFALISAITVFAVSFYAYLHFQGLTLDDALSRGWLVGTNGTSARQDFVLAPLLVSLAHVDVVASEVWTIGVVTLLTVLGLVMNVSALEVQTGRQFNLDIDMRSAGLANVLASLGGGFPGYHSVSMYELSRHLLRDPAPVCAAIAALTLAMVTVFGMSVFESLPKGVFGITLSFLGVEFLRQWIVQAWWRVPRSDFLVILSIVVTALLFDVAAAILLGLLLSMLLFTLAYSRLEVVHAITTGAIRLSSTERSERDIQALVERGHETLVVELQGYLFFGTAKHIFERVSGAIARDRDGLRRVIVDFRRVDGLDTSTSFVFARLAEFCSQRSLEFILTDLNDDEQRKLKNLTERETDARVVPSLNEALIEVEERILASTDGLDAVLSNFGAMLADATVRGLPLVAETRHLKVGDTVFEQGADGNSVAYLSEGLLSAWIKPPDKPEARVAGYLPGAVVGEIAFAAGRRRIATIRADRPSIVLIITRGSLMEAAMEDPSLAAHFNALLSQLLAERLSRTTALYFAADG